MSPRWASTRAALAGALLVSLVATAWSISLSGIGPTGWYGFGLFPCELCWYQRILMYPLPALLAIGLWRRDGRVGLYVLPLAALGLLVASYHIALQTNPTLEAGQCFVGSCSVVDKTFFGLTIPKLSFLAFLLTGGLSAWSLRRARSKAS